MFEPYDPVKNSKGQRQERNINEGQLHQKSQFSCSFQTHILCYFIVKFLLRLKLLFFIDRHKSRISGLNLKSV